MCPRGGGDWFAVMLTLESGEWFNANFEERAADIVESEEACERPEGHSIGRKRPISDKVEFRLGGTVAIGSNVMTDTFDAVSQKLAFLQLESDAVFQEDGARAFEEAEQGGEASGP